ncbi:MAG TPA: M20/M25/M40 family metallo-hydrolase [Candidatus Polarisedimenticolia bacterium]|jgi:acetylornithine deacetylase/succinyl-diaminopimelate desuccinylase-like protein|nr:M20/M25/M40 family metallo-hydrolase [Candidatus Polarisedimenticolia bacterium]
MTAPGGTEDPRAIREAARALRPFIVDLTLRVCRARTVNYMAEDFPGGGPDDMPAPGMESRVTSILAEECRRLKIPFTTHAKVEGRESLLATVGQKRPGYRRMLVLLHTDTVPAGSPTVWKRPPFEPVEEGGTLYGRGVLDDKGPLAASFAALRLLKEREDRIPGAFTFGAVADEEVGIGVGLPSLIESGLIDCTDAVIPDIAGNMKEINIAEKGRVLLKVETRGKQAHAMEPAKGVNAILALSRALLAVERMTLEHRAHPLLGGPTINTGLARGGVAPNAVPADAQAILDIRYVPGQTAEGIRAAVAAAATKAIVDLPGSSVEVAIVQDALPCEVSPEAPIVKRLLRHAPEAKIIGSGGGTFAKDLVLMGVDAVGWSCGDEETYHQPNEEIEVEQLVTFAGRLAALAIEIASEKVAGA